MMDTKTAIPSRIVIVGGGVATESGKVLDGTGSRDDQVQRYISLSIVNKISESVNSTQNKDTSIV